MLGEQGGIGQSKYPGGVSNKIRSNWTRCLIRWSSSFIRPELSRRGSIEVDTVEIDTAYGVADRTWHALSFRIEDTLG